MKTRQYPGFQGGLKYSPPILHVFSRSKKYEGAGYGAETSFHLVKRHRDARSRVDLSAVIGDGKNPFWKHNHQRGSDRVDDVRHV
jgi:hypothetical protein